MFLLLNMDVSGKAGSRAGVSLQARHASFPSLIVRQRDCRKLNLGTAPLQPSINYSQLEKTFRDGLS
jgi:hypothetical protein